MPTPVSETRISTRPSLVGAAPMVSVPPFGHRLHGVLREVQQAWRRMPGSASISGTFGAIADFERHAGDVGFDSQRLQHFVDELARRDRPAASAPRAGRTSGIPARRRPAAGFRGR